MENLNHRFNGARVSPWLLLGTVVFVGMITPYLHAAKKDKISYGEGLIVNVPFPEPVVEQVVQEVADSGIIRGTKEYNKDEYVTGAKAADSSKVFPKWTEGGKVFYKVKLQALDPRNFKEGGDLGTLAVRYVLKPQGDKNTVLRIDAIFVEEFRKTVHTSNGSVEGGEYKDIRDHLDAIDVMNQQTAEAEREREQLRQKRATRGAAGAAGYSTNSSGQAGSAAGGATTANAAPPGQSVMAQNAPAESQPGPSASSQPSSSPAVPRQAGSSQGMANAAVPGQSTTGQSVPDQSVPDQSLANQSLAGQGQAGEGLEQRVQNLRRQVERLVKSPGAPLKSAPYHTANTLSALATGTEVLVLISTPYWYGVETRDGQHGWVFRDSVESLP